SKSTSNCRIARTMDFLKYSWFKRNHFIGFINTLDSSFNRTEMPESTIWYFWTVYDLNRQSNRQMCISSIFIFRLLVRTVSQSYASRYGNLYSIISYMESQLFSSSD